MHDSLPLLQNRSVEELEDYEMQILNKMKKAAQAQRETTPNSTPTATPTATPDKSLPKPADIGVSPVSSFTSFSPSPSPNHSFTSFSPSPSPSKFETPTRNTQRPIDVDNPTATSPINVDSPSTPTPIPPIIDVDSTNNKPTHTTSPLPQGGLDFESISMMKLRQAAERKKLLEELEKNT